MRIIAGEARGRRIEAPAGRNTRPTLDRIRENMFNILQADIPESRILDLFAGSGALSLEAISRGAASAVLVDSDRKASMIQKQNAESLRFNDRTRLYCCDWTRAVRTLQEEKQKFDIIFLDPPYAMTDLRTVFTSLIPLMEKMQGYGADYTDVTADAGYESEENYTWFEEAEKECYIKPQNYERSKTKKFKGNMALRENMPYDADLDEYTCQAGQKLRAKYESDRKSASGYVSRITHYECDDCSGCPYKKSCTRAKGNRKMQVSKRFVQQRAESLERITSEKGILLRMNRSIQSEGAFGVIKQDYGFRQFLLRGHKKVLTEILLVAMAYNINKLHAKIQQNRTGTQLFKKVPA